MRKKLVVNESFEDFITGRRLSSPDAYVVLVRGSHMQTLSELYHEIASALQFPDYFGGNWNAVDDCLQDLGWIKEKKYIIGIERFEEILSYWALESKARETEMDYFVDCLESAVQAWAGRMVVYIQEKGEAYQLCPP